MSVLRLCGCLSFESSQPLAFVFPLQFSPNWTGSTCQHETQLGVFAASGERKPSRKNGDFGKPTLSPATRGFPVFTTLPVSDSDIAKCDSLYRVTKCSYLCKSRVSQSHAPDCRYMKLQNPTWCKSPRESLGYYCNSTNCSWTRLYCNNHPLSAFGIWPKAMDMSQDQPGY